MEYFSYLVGTVQANIGYYFLFSNSLFSKAVTIFKNIFTWASFCRPVLKGLKQTSGWIHKHIMKIKAEILNYLTEGMHKPYTGLI